MFSCRMGGPSKINFHGALNHWLCPLSLQLNRAKLSKNCLFKLKPTKHWSPRYSSTTECLWKHFFMFVKRSASPADVLKIWLLEQTSCPWLNKDSKTQTLFSTLSSWFQPWTVGVGDLWNLRWTGRVLCSLFAWNLFWTL